ncbi:uncharacterized protein LOC126686014 [Mercurialis annua]|uniref:uncharacterized protein LOC126686014 n=1 Tax=Mercurialis annua TaxID=3986 RepID=UPI0021600B40|nr:uncharacterized protein LOC126686014 [Mercurialis annua]
MATTLANRASLTTNQTLRTLLIRCSSFNFSKTFSTGTATTSPTDANATAINSSKKKKKKKNFFEIAQFLPNWGLGYHLAKSHWKDVSYELTKIKLNKDGKHGKAWGIAHKNGLPAAVAAPKRISGVHKRGWKYIRGLSKSSESKPTSTLSTETAPKVEVEAA